MVRVRIPARTEDPALAFLDAKWEDQPSEAALEYRDVAITRGQEADEYREIAHSRGQHVVNQQATIERQELTIASQADGLRELSDLLAEAQRQGFLRPRH